MPSPYVVALVVLSRERRNGFVRFHATPSLLFFVTIPLLQVTRYIALVVVWEYD
jgi:uncharacterized membrane protein